MKKLNLISTISLVLTILISSGFVSCKKSTVGPTGAQGATGQQGLTGAQGNANVKAITFSTGCNWKIDSVGKTYSYRFHVADITTSVIEQGLVTLLQSDDQGSNGNEWRAMPFSLKTYDYNYKVELSTVEIFISSTNGTMPPNPGSQKFKVVIIPPAI